MQQNNAELRRFLAGQKNLMLLQSTFLQLPPLDGEVDDCLEGPSLSIRRSAWMLVIVFYPVTMVIGRMTVFPTHADLDVATVLKESKPKLWVAIQETRAKQCHGL